MDLSNTMRGSETLGDELVTQKRGSETLCEDLEIENKSIESLISLLSVNENKRTPVQKFKKVKRTSFWGVELDATVIKSHPSVAQTLENNTELVPLKAMHTTLLFVGGKECPDETQFHDHLSKKCVVTVSGHGFSGDAIALKVGSIKFVDDGETVPTFATTPHVTVALAKNVKAVDSVKTLESNEHFVQYDEPFVLHGEIKRNICFVKVPYIETPLVDQLLDVVHE